MDIQFGNYRLKRAERLLLGPEGSVELSARSFDILVTLLGKPDEVVSKSDLFDIVWPNLVVEENTLQVHISALRKVLTPGMIATVHGRGYKYAGARPMDVPADERGAPSSPAGLAEPVAPAGHKPVIAVLPFVNVSGDAEQEYFSDGITEDIIVALSRYRPLKVVSPHSSSRFKGLAVDVREVADKLGAQYLVEGSVRKVGGGVRITAQLLEAATASHVWAERYDRMLDDVLAVQDELVKRVASTIVGHVEMHTDNRARTKATESLDAYDCWLRANHGSVLWTPEGNLACQRFLEQAIKRDPLFARAHASLAFCHIRTATLNPGSDQAIPLHRAAVVCAEHAVGLDPFEARARNALGWSQMYFREFERARSEFKQAAALNPNDGSACIDRALALAFLGEQDAADATAEIAAVLNPLGGEWYWSVRAMVHFVAGRHDTAEACFALALRGSPDVSAWHASNLTHLGRHQQAAERMRHALDRLGAQWRGSSPMQPDDFVSWFRHVNMLRRDEDWDHLVAGFPKDVLLPGDRVGV